MEGSGSNPVELKSIVLTKADPHGKEAIEKATERLLDKFHQVKERRKKIRNRTSHSNSGKTRMFNIKCNFGTDDFFFLSLFAMGLRAAWLAYGMVVCAYIFTLHTECTAVQVPLTLLISLPGLLAFALLSIICYLLAVVISSRGSLIRHEPRERVVDVAYALTALLAVELCWYIFSTYAVVAAGVGLPSPDVAEGSGSGELEEGIVSDDLPLCSQYRSWVVHFGVLVGLDWVCCALIAFMFIFGLDPCGCFLPSTVVKRLIRAQRLEGADFGLEKSLAEFDKLDGIPGYHSNAPTSSLFCSRLRQSCCFCCRRDGLSTSTINAFSDVVQLLSLLFGDIDPTYTDLMAGFLLASLYHKQLKAANKDIGAELNKATLQILRDGGVVSPSYSSPPPTQLSTEEAKMLAEDFRYYFRFCAASYGCPIHLYLHPFTGPFSLCLAAKGCCCCCNFCQLQHFDGDTCYPNGPAIEAIADIRQEDLVTASFVNGVYKVPYYAAYLPEEKKLVVAIRGTLSLKDALTDVSVTMQRMPDGFLGVENAYIHRGFYNSALYIYKCLMERPLFKERLNTTDVKEVVITGHSLGAAVASVLAALFKDCHQHEPWIDRLRAVTFAAPAACMSYNLAEKTSDFITTVVCTNDIVSRVTIRSLGYLKQLIQTMLVSVDAPKHQVLCCSGSTALQCCTPEVLEEENMLGLSYTKAELQSLEALNLEADLDTTQSFKALRVYKPSVSINPTWRKEKTREVIRNFNKQLEQVKGGAEKREDQPMMFLPGRVLHLEETQQYQRNKLKKYRKVRGTWKARETMSTIIVDKDMLLDHLPHRLDSLLHRFQNYPDFSEPPQPSTSEDLIDGLRTERSATA